MANKTYTNPTDITAPFSNGGAVTLHDTNELSMATRGIMVTTVGNVAVTLISGESVTLPACQPGIIYPVRAKIIKSTGTTATGLVWLA